MHNFNTKGDNIVFNENNRKFYYRPPLTNSSNCHEQCIKFVSLVKTKSSKVYSGKKIQATCFFLCASWQRICTHESIVFNTCNAKIAFANNQNKIKWINISNPTKTSLLLHKLCILHFGNCKMEVHGSPQWHNKVSVPCTRTLPNFR